MPDSDGPDLDARSIHEATILQSVINAVPAPIFYKDSEGRYLGCNKAFENFVGRSRDELVGKGVFELWDKDLAQVYHDADTALYDAGGKQIYEAQVTYADGTVHDVVFHKAVFFAEEEGVSGIVGAMLDITERKRSEAELERMARTDALTGLANRHILYEHLENASKRARRTGKLMAVLALDLDGFKVVNDRFGHAAGDAVLREVARRLKATLRDSDVIARQGGDEFVIILEAAGSEAEVDHVASKIIAEFLAPFLWHDESLSVGVSIGIAMHGRDGDEGETLMRHADRALYAAKAAGKGRFSHY
ncbi:MAG: diguanylate cyclase domain-containing protein [Rhodospirillales bacterium]